MRHPRYEKPSLLDAVPDKVWAAAFIVAAVALIVAAVALVALYAFALTTAVT